MSNILIIKHGSLGDIIQANGAIKDIKKNFSDQKSIVINHTTLCRFYVFLSLYRWSFNRQKITKMEFILSCQIKKND